MLRHVSVKKSTLGTTGPSRLSQWIRLAIGCWSAIWGIGASSGSNSATWDHETRYLFTVPQFTWDDKDPFTPFPGHAETTETEPKLELVAIMEDGDQSEAIINGERFKVGDTVGWRTLDFIGRNYVLLSYGNESVIELNIPEPRGPFSRIELNEVSDTP